MFTYSAICDVPEETLRHVAALLHVHRREIGTRAGRRAGTARTQAKLVLRWFRDDAPIRLLSPKNPVAAPKGETAGLEGGSPPWRRRFRSS